MSIFNIYYTTLFLHFQYFVFISQLNFFNVGQSFRVVDMPGYGFAQKTPKAHAAEWQQLIGYFLIKVVLV